MKPDAYQRNLAARAFDVARYLLFWGVPTNVGQVTSIRTLEKQIRRLKASEYARAAGAGRRDRAGLRRRAGLPLGRRRRGRAAGAHAGAPRRPRRARRRGPATISSAGPRRTCRARRAAAMPRRVDLLRPAQRPRRYRRHAALSGHRPAVPRAVRNGLRLERGPARRGDRRGARLAHAAATRSWPVSAAASTAYDLVIDIGAYRDLHRHRRCQKFRQAYSGRLGYDTPPLVAEAGAGEIYDAAMRAGLGRDAPPAGARAPTTCCPSARARASSSKWISPRPNTSRGCAAA